MSARAALSDPSPNLNILTRIHGVIVPDCPLVTGDWRSRLIDGSYARTEILGALDLVTETDRVLEFGAGLGVTSAAIAVAKNPMALLSFEANPALIDHTRQLYRENGVEDRIELRNAVPTIDVESPGTIPLYLGNNGLDASVIAAHAASDSVDVPMERLPDIIDNFRPTVLVMDIRGAELDLLKDADLSSLRALIITFHPAITGADGTRECKRLVRDAGFSKLTDLSTRLVWTCERTSPPTARRSDAPRAKGGWSEEIRSVEAAIIVPPPLKPGLSFPAGVLTAEGKFCSDAATWRGWRRITEPPTAPDTVDAQLEGTWLWGGLLYAHFGHFLVESVTRLWALDHLPEDVRGILFIAKFDTNQAGIRSFQSDFVRLMGTDLPVQCITEPAQVERLIVPGQGFGLGPAIEGTDLFRSAVATRFASDVAPDGPDKLYISRSGLGPKRGGLVFEDRLEALLADEGYEIFHPEKHDLATQIARYKAATHILAAEGSALHLYAFVGHAKQKVGIVVRRLSKATENIRVHIESFAKADVTIANAVGRRWLPEGPAPSHMTLSEIDFPKLHEQLRSAGFVAAEDPWPAVSEDEAREEVLGNASRQRRGYHVKPPRKTRANRPEG